jgi:hypothetical protein
MNTTETLQMLWAKKHHVTDACVRDLYYIIRDDRFDKEEFVSASTLKRRAACLPTDPAYGLNLENEESEVDAESGESVKTNSEFAFSSLKDKITRALHIPSIRLKLRGANTARHAAICKELRDGTQYWQSPFFTVDRLEVRKGVFVNLGDRVECKLNGGELAVFHLCGIAINEETKDLVCRLRRYRHFADPKLPTPSSATKRELGLPAILPDGELVLTEEFEVWTLGDFDRILRAVSVGARGTADLDFICNVAVSASRHWSSINSIDVHPCDQHSFDSSRLRAAESAGIEIVRLFIILYIDGFGLFRRAAHTTDGIYAALGNLDRNDRHQLENIWCLGMKPPGTSLDACLQPVLSELKELQRGYYLHLANELKPVFVIGSLGVCLADMPQAQTLAGCQHQSANQPCRRCKVTKGEQLGDAYFDINAALRTSQDVAAQRSQSGIGNGVGKESPFAHVQGFDPVRGTPTEPMHSELGLCKTLLGLFFQSLTEKYVKQLSRFVRAGTWPWKIPPIKVSKDGKINLTFKQTSRFMQISPFVLTRRVQTNEGVTLQDWLKPSMFTEAAREALSMRVGPTFCKDVREGLILAAVSNAAVFVEQRSNGADSLRVMNEAIVSSRHHNARVWGAALHRPNAHTGLHIAETALLYGVPNNVNAGRFETRHAGPKTIAANSNYRGLERQMLVDSQIQEAILYIARGGSLGSHNTSLSTSALEMLQTPDDMVTRLLNVSGTDYHGGDGEGFDEEVATRASLSHGLVWSKYTESYLLTSSEHVVASVVIEDAAASRGPPVALDVPVACFRHVGLPGREIYRAHVTIGEYWQVHAPHTTRLPAGPEPSLAIMRVERLLQIGDQGFVHPVWLGRTSTAPQKMTLCHRYELRTASLYPRLIPLSWLDVRVHVHDVAGTLIVNSMFIK